MKSFPERLLWRFCFCAPLGIVAVFSHHTYGQNEVPYGVGSWAGEEFGNHRARIHVAERAEAVWVRIPWRRRDSEPEKKNIIVVDAATRTPVTNLLRVNINREFGEIVFQPATVPGDYFVYYMPYKHKGLPYCPNTVYTVPADTANAAWRERCGLTERQLAEGKWMQLPQAKVIDIQASSEFNRFDPMEVIATAAELKQLLGRYPGQAYLLFPEDRLFPIRMTDDLPLRWIKAGPRDEFRGQVRPGEFYTFQIGVYAARDSIEGIQITYSDLKAADGKGIPASAVRCFNLGGTDWLGRMFSKVVSVGKGKVQGMWFGVQIPKDAVAGEYEGTLTLQPNGGKATQVTLRLDVRGEVLADAGDGELWRHSRLRWLDSTLGLDEEVFGSFTPMEVEDNTVRILGRKVQYGEAGLPASIVSTFTSAVDSTDGPKREILARPMALVVETEDGPITWAGGQPRVVEHKSGAVELQADSTGGVFSLQCRAKMECDGYINYWLTVKPDRNVDVKDIRLEIPLRREIAKYMMGLGCKGGYRPKGWKWNWDIKYANSALWLGDVSAGLHCKLKGPKDTWELYNFRDSGIPADWYNAGKGGCTVSEESEDIVLVRAYSGPRTIKQGEELLFRFGLLITPVKVLDKGHWSWRYCQTHKEIWPMDRVARAGANIINVHQAQELNPFINYPFIVVDKLKAYIDKAHSQDIKVKLYYTVRELSNHTAEIWALRSLGDEIYRQGPGFHLADEFISTDHPPKGDVTTGNSWLCEHLITNYVPAWHEHYGKGVWDAAIATTGLSRWHNYYLEGLAWLIKNIGVDGIYLDGIGYDREIMKRLRKVMDQARPGCLIDFHCGNHFRPQYGLSSIANQFMEHFPFIDSLWLGEGFNYDESPDYWLVEISGIPFGLFGEMLHDGGNPWRGMVYGMTTRLPWSGDPTQIWKVWDEFGIKEAKMIGYWSQRCPVKTNHKDVLATAYVKEDKTLISLASWAEQPVDCRLDIDWTALGLDATKARLYAPPVSDFQTEHLFKPGDEIPVQPARGWLLVVDEHERSK